MTMQLLWRWQGIDFGVNLWYIIVNRSSTHTGFWSVIEASSQLSDATMSRGLNAVRSFCYNIVSAFSRVGRK